MFIWLKHLFRFIILFKKFVQRLSTKSLDIIPVWDDTKTYSITLFLDSSIIGFIISKLLALLPEDSTKLLYFQTFYHLVIASMPNFESVFMINLCWLKWKVSLIAIKKANSSPLMLLYGLGFNKTLLSRFHNFWCMYTTPEHDMLFLNPPSVYAIMSFLPCSVSFLYKLNLYSSSIYFFFLNFSLLNVVGFGSSNVQSF